MTRRTLLGLVAALAVLLAVQLVVGFLREAEPIAAVSPVPCPTPVPVATATPDGGPTYTPTLTHTPCLIKPTSTPTPSVPEISLSARGPLMTCDGQPSTGKGDVPKPDKCDVLVGGSFTLSIEISAAPAAGYTAVQTEILHGALTYKEAPEAQDEIVLPGCAPVRDQVAGLVAHACLTSGTKLNFVGNIVELQFNCTSFKSSNSIDLLPYLDPRTAFTGTLFVEFGTGAIIAPDVDSLGINCVNSIKLPEPGDFDGDGCSDQRENGPDETLGGLRDYKNPNDFYDVLGGGGGPPDQIIDLPNDILGVIQHYAPTGLEPTYDVNFDRGPSAGPNVWNMTAPDGVIDLSNDILGVIRQFQHDCR